MHAASPVVQLTSATAAYSPAVVAAAIPEAIVADPAAVAIAVQLATGENPEFGAAGQADAIVEAAEATTDGLHLAARTLSVLLQPLVWLVQVLPAPLKPYAGGVLLFSMFVGGAIAAAIDNVLDPILAFFGLRSPAPGPLAAEDPSARGAETLLAVTGDTGAADATVEPAALETEVSETEAAAVTAADVQAEPETVAQAEAPEATPADVVTEPVAAEPDLAEVEESTDVEVTEHDTEEHGAEEAGPEESEQLAGSEPEEAGPADGEEDSATDLDDDPGEASDEGVSAESSPSSEAAAS
ncbi:hypothetical protein [Mycolicibacterium sp.]|uniref:hypothetical protein n=1 Tax=Mycolicibacterium sp. TaxID=2320850 RepID=UPI003D0E6E99